MPVGGAVPPVCEARLKNKFRNLKVKKKERESDVMIDNHLITTQPILVSLGAHSLSVATLVVVSDGRGRHLGCSMVFISLIYHLYSISTPGQVLEE